jgi:hypothetical protein
MYEHELYSSKKSEVCCHCLDIFNLTQDWRFKSERCLKCGQYCHQICQINKKCGSYILPILKCHCEIYWHVHVKTYLCLNKGYRLF